MLAAGEGLCRQRRSSARFAYVSGGLRLTAVNETLEVGVLWSGAHTFDSEITPCCKSLKTSVILHGWEAGIRPPLTAFS
jgi:hypothetical protein